MPFTSARHFSSGELGDLLGIQAWKIARLFELGAVAEPPRIGGRRLIPQEMIPEIVDALRARGWIPMQGSSFRRFKSNDDGFEQ